MHDLLIDLLTDAHDLILDEAAEILGCDPVDILDVLSEPILPTQRLALETLVGVDELDRPTAIELLDLADVTLERRSMGHIGALRLARWQASLLACPLPRGTSPAAGSLLLPALQGDLPTTRRDLNRTIRALCRLVWGAAFLRAPIVAAQCRRTYGLADLAPIFGDVLRAGHDDVYLARRARQLVDALNAFDALGPAHKGAGVARDLGIAQ